MSTISSVVCGEKNYSYQHIQGVMLLNLNKLACEINLSHSEYRLTATLIGLWNKQKGMAFPTIEYLAKHCRMGKATVIKNLNRLVELHLLIVVKSNNKRNNYYFSKLILNTGDSSQVKPPHSSTCETTHDHELIKNKTDKNITLSIKYDDKSFKTSNISEYKQVLEILNSWGYVGAQKLIKQKGIEEIKKLINIVELKNPDKPGAYLRSLINVPGDFISKQEETAKNKPEPTQIDQLLKCKYWRHIPSGEIHRALPDIGKHLLFQYHHKENLITFLEKGFTDKLENFKGFFS